MATTETLAEQHARAAEYIMSLHYRPRHFDAAEIHLPDLPSASPCIAEGGPDAPTH